MVHRQAEVHPRCTPSRPVDPGEAEPRPYIRMAARLRRQILAGEMAPGQPLPSLATLSQEFGHARMTCGKAIRLLEQEGLPTFIPAPRVSRYFGG